MKKLFLLFSCCALVVACDSKSSKEAGGVESADRDSTSSAQLSAATRQPSDVDTNAMNIGTDRTEGTTALPDAEKGGKLIAQSDCTACHRDDQKLVGPAYTAVAEKYDVSDKTLEYLAGKIKQGGKGVWGEVPMTPHPALSDEDAKAMAQYVMSLKK